MEFTVLLIWYGKLPGESEREKKKKRTWLLSGRLC